MMKRKELALVRNQKIEEIEKKVYDLKSQLRQAQVDIATGSVKDLKKARKLKTEIAQLLTIKTEKQKS